jgi:hypothetical protein
MTLGPRITFYASNRAFARECSMASKSAYYAIRKMEHVQKDFSRTIGAVLCKGGRIPGRVSLGDEYGRNGMIKR